MERVAVGFAKSVLNSVVNVATTAITDEIGLLLGVQEELFFIKEELEMMQAFLRVASAEDAKGETVTTWVNQVENLAYDIEDCLQEASVCLRKKGFLNTMFSSKSRDRIARMIKVLKVRIEDVSKRNLRYHLIRSSTTNVPNDSLETPVPRLTANDEALIVGLTEPKQDLLKLISENPDRWKVISVVGMGGLGKTTLVKNVYGSPELSNIFMCFAWITVLHPFSKEEFVQSLAKQFSLLNEGRFNLEEMENKIIEYLKNRRHVIVLDDLATEVEWKNMSYILQNEFRGSRIIVTTRSETLAEYISESRDIYKIKALSENDSLELFYKAVYRNSDNIPSIYKHRNNSPGESSSKKSGLGKEKVDAHGSDDTQKMERQAVEIIKRCGQLPLAIVAIGSFLATRSKNSIEWSKMHDHIAAEIKNNPHLESIKIVLTTSYNGLPYDLKSCFLYLSVFHNHQEIRRSRIIRRWMAEGFLIERYDMMAEEVGERYFYELMGKSLIQPSESIIVENDAVTHCNVHDLIYEMIVAKSGNENVVSFIRDESCIRMNGKARHVVIQDCQEVKNNALRRMKLSKIRSVTLFGKVELYTTYHKMRLLRVLDLEGSLEVKNRDIRIICKLRHLKYLGLRGTAITKLPGSLEKLHDLETLDIRDTWVLDLPRGIVKLQKLSYLRAGFDHHKNPEFYYRYKPSKFLKISMHAYVGLLFIICFLPIKGGIHLCKETTNEMHNSIRYCKCICGDHLEKAMNGPGRLTNFGSFGVKAPRDIGKLWSLRNFGLIDIGRSNASAKELKFLRNLKKIAIAGFSKKNGKILGEAIQELIHLKSLVLSALDDSGLGCCLKSINTPPKYLQSLKLLSPIGKLPEWFSSLDNLVKLHCRDTNLKVEEIKVIEKLSNLKILALLEDSFEENQLCFDSNSFPKLPVMVLSSITTWYDRQEPIKVLIEKDALKKLAHLKIHDRETWILERQQKLRENGIEKLIARWELKGLENLNSLKEVVLDDLNVDVVESVKGMILRNPNKPDVRLLNIPT